MKIINDLTISTMIDDALPLFVPSARRATYEDMGKPQKSFMDFHESKKVGEFYAELAYQFKDYEFAVDSRQRQQDGGFVFANHYISAKTVLERISSWLLRRTNPYYMQALIIGARLDIQWFPVQYIEGRVDQPVLNNIEDKRLKLYRISAPYLSNGELRIADVTEFTTSALISFKHRESGTISPRNRRKVLCTWLEPEQIRETLARYTFGTKYALGYFAD